MRTIELDWIRRFDKSLPLPQFATFASADYGGLYYSPYDCEELIDGRFVDRSNGIVAISEARPEDFAKNIAHEWRHHWQQFHGWILNSFWEPSTDNYDKAIIDYFTRFECEADALRFENRFAGCHEHWKELLSPTGFCFK